MNETRRERIRELIRLLKTAQSRIEDVCSDEERAAEVGNMSEEAVDYLNDAAMDIESAITACSDAIGDDYAAP
jgi:hypothetical protein